MIKIQTLHSEVITFLKLYSFFNSSVNERIEMLIATGELDNENAYEAVKQKYNQLILESFNFSKLIKNSYLERRIKEITGNDIIILDHKDESIIGVSCIACNYIVFESKEDAYYEICPVCMWQNDGKKDNEYSGSNHCTLNDYKNTDEFRKKLILGNEKYVKNIKVI